MRNDHYGIRKKARKRGKWHMKQDSLAGKFRTQNLVVTYIVSKLKKSGVQEFKQCTNQSWKWKSYGHLKTTMQSWRTISKWFWNSTYEFEIQFEMTPILNSPTSILMFRLIYIENFI